MEQEDPRGGPADAWPGGLCETRGAPAAADPDVATLLPAGRTISTLLVHPPPPVPIYDEFGRLIGISATAAAIAAALRVDRGLVAPPQYAETATASAAPPVDQRRRGSRHDASEEREDGRTWRST